MLQLRRWKKNAWQVIKATSYLISVFVHLTPYFVSLALEELSSISSGGGSYSNQPIPLRDVATPTDSDDDNVPIVKTIVDTKRKSNFVGMKVARDFGQTGVFIGEVVEC